jgi:hypothetical protein
VIWYAKDSSRYFILNILSQDGEKEAFIGLGFKTQASSLDFKIAV